MVRTNTKTREISPSSGDDTDDSSGLEDNQLPKQLQNLIDTYNEPKKKRKIFNGDEIASLKLRPSIVQRALQKNVISSTPATKTFGKFFTSDSSYSPIGYSSDNSEVEKKRAKLSDPILISDSDYQTDFQTKKSYSNENNKNASPRIFSNKSPVHTIYKSENGSLRSLENARDKFLFDNCNDNNENASPSRFSNKSPSRTINEATTDKTPIKLVTSRMHTSKDHSKCRSDVIENGRFSNKSPGRTINEATTDKTPNKSVTSKMQTSKDRSKCRSDVIENGRFSNKSPGRTINEATTDKTPNKLVTSKMQTSKDRSKCRSDVIENGRFSNKSPGRTTNEATTDKTPNRSVTSKMQTSKDRSKCRSDVIENGRFSNKSPGRRINEATTDKTPNKLVTSRMQTSTDRSICSSDLIRNNKNEHRPSRSLGKILENESITHTSRLQTMNDSKYLRSESSRDKFLFDNGNDNNQNASSRRYSNRSHTNRVQTAKDSRRPELSKYKLFDNNNDDDKNAGSLRRYSVKSPGRTINEKDKTPRNELVSSRGHISKDRKRKTLEDLDTNTQKKINIKNNKHFTPKEFSDQENSGNTSRPYQNITLRKSDFTNRVYKSQSKKISDDTSDSESEILIRKTKRNSTNKNKSNVDAKIQLKPNSTLQTLHLKVSKNKSIQTSVIQDAVSIENEIQNKSKEITKNSLSTTNVLQNKNSPVFVSKKRRLSNFIDEIVHRKSRSSNKNSSYQKLQDKEVQTSCDSGTSVAKELEQKNYKNDSMSTNLVDTVEQGNIYDSVASGSIVERFSSFYNHNCLENNLQPWRYSGSLSNVLRNTESRLSGKYPSTTTVNRRSIKNYLRGSCKKIGLSSEEAFHTPTQSFVDVELSPAASETESVDQNHGIEKWLSDVNNKMNRSDSNRNFKNTNNRISYTEEEEENLTDSNTEDSVMELHSLISNSDTVRNKKLKPRGTINRILTEDTENKEENYNGPNSECSVNELQHSLISNSNKLRKERKQLKPKSSTNKTLINKDAKDTEEEENNGANSESSVNELQHSVISNSNKLRKDQKQLKPKSSINKTLINKNTEEEENNNGANSESSVNELQHSVISNSNKLRKEQKQLKPKSSINKTLINKDAKDTEEEENNNGANSESSVNELQHSVISNSNKLRKEQKQLKPKSSINKTLINKDAKDTEEEENNNGANSEISVNELQHSVISNSNKLRKEQKQLKPKSSINKTLINKNTEEEENTNGANSESSVNELQHSVISNSNKLRKEQKQLKPKNSINKTLINKDAEDAEEEENNNGANSESSVNELLHSVISNSNKLRKEQKQLKPKCSINKILINEVTEDKEEENYNVPNLENSVNEHSFNRIAETLRNEEKQLKSKEESYDANKKDDVDINKEKRKLCIVLENIKCTTAPEEEKETKIKENKEAKTNRKKKIKQKKDRQTEEIPIIVNTGRPVRQRRPPPLGIYDLQYVVNPTITDIKFFNIKGDISKSLIQNKRISKAKANSRKTSKKLINDEDSSSQSDEEYNIKTTKANKTVKKSRGRYQTKKSETNKSENKLPQKDSVILENSCNFPNTTRNRDLDGKIQDEPDLQKRSEVFERNENNNSDIESDPEHDNHKKSSSKVKNTGKKSRGRPPIKKSVTNNCDKNLKNRNSRSKFISKEDSTIPENSCNLPVETVEQQLEPDPMNNSNHFEASEINENCNIINGNNSNMDLCENDENPLLQQDRFRRLRKLSEHDSGRSSTMVEDCNSRNVNIPKITVKGVLTTEKKSRKTISKNISRKSQMKITTDQYLDIQENGIDRFKFVEKNATFTEMEDNLIYSDSLNHTTGTSIIYLQIPPGKAKKVHVCKKHDLFYVVHEGRGKVVVKDKISPIEKLSRVIIPVGHSYSIQNDSQTEDLLLNCFRVPVT